MRIRIAILGVLLVSVTANAAEAPAVADARQFLDEVNTKLADLAYEAGLAEWINNTYITEDTDLVAASADERLISTAVQYAKDATRFDDVELPDDLARQMKLLKLGVTMPTPKDPAESREITRIAARMQSMYGTGEYCSGDNETDCLDLEEITEIMRTSRDADELLDVWRGWRTVSPPMRDDYARFVELSNKGSRELGFDDTGVMWRSKYDMDPDAFSRELDRLWEQVRPLYVSLHTYVRAKLRERYGPDVVPADGPIPAHLLGNPWAQSWENIYDLVAPGTADPGYNLTSILRSRGINEHEMVRYGERFFTSLGFLPLPGTFWDRSLFVKPEGRDVVCHASAWDVDNVDDLRIKMCIVVNEEDFVTIHHELGHNFYQRAYNQLPLLFRDSANDGFHEAIGDTIALSVTPEYLVNIGLLDEAPDPSKDIGLLMRRALEKVAFLPFGLLIDQWRWKVFSGETPPDQYNQSWWELREKYQGIAAPVERPPDAFDPGAKFHVPANVPYTRYFLADILQFQFHRALSEVAGCTGPLHRCSIYENKEAGNRLMEMLEMGQSRPWPEALEVMTGSREMDATAILDYFAPLKEWLDEQNKGLPEGW